MKNRFLFVFLIFCCAQILWSGEVWGQSCGTCTITFSGNGSPSPNRNVQVNDVVCIKGNRSTSINLQWVSGVKVCIEQNVIMSGSFTGYAANTNFTVNGQLGTSGSPTNLNITSGTFNNYGSVIGNLTLYTSTTGIFNNFGNLSGKLVVDGGNTVNNSGTISLTDLKLYHYSYLTNTASGVIDVKFQEAWQILGFNGTITNEGKFDINRSFRVDGGSIFNNVGDFTTQGNYQNDGKTSALGGSINIGGSLDVNNGSTYNTSYTNVKENTKIDGTIGLAGELIVNGNLTNYSSGKIVALNANQCNSVIVDGIFFTDAQGGITDNYLNYENTGSALFVNKEPTGSVNPKLGGTAKVGSCLLVLPVEFLYFNATYQSRDRSALISWSSSKEWGNSHFEIERAVNSVKTWETIGRVEGNGYSDMPVEYNFTDDDLPKSGGNVFYRLKQVDYSGQFSYSVTRAIQVPKIDGKNNWTAYPNPSVRGTLVQVELVQAENYHDQSIYISLSNLLGQTKSISLSSPGEISPLISSWLDSSVSGLYILDITWADQSQQLKLLRH